MADQFQCDRCGCQLTKEEVHYIACEGLFCESCEIALLEQQVSP